MGNISKIAEEKKIIGVKYRIRNQQKYLPVKTIKHTDIFCHNNSFK